MLCTVRFGGLAKWQSHSWSRSAWGKKKDIVFGYANVVFVSVKRFVKTALKLKNAKLRLKCITSYAQTFDILALHLPDFERCHLVRTLDQVFTKFLQLFLQLWVDCSVFKKNKQDELIWFQISLKLCCEFYCMVSPYGNDELISKFFIGNNTKLLLFLCNWTKDSFCSDRTAKRI